MTTPSLTNPNPKREARYYAKGEVVFKSPVHKRKADGTTSITIGFPVCEVSDYIGSEGAASLAEMLCVAEDANGAPPRPSEKVTLDYTNYRGERAIRTITPWGVEWGSTDWHPEPGWLLTCYDHDKAACRTYALSGIHSWNGVAVLASARPSPGDPVRAALEAELDLIDGTLRKSGYVEPHPVYASLQSLRTALSVSTPTGEGELREAAQMFVNHYPHGLNPHLDKAYALASNALAHPQQEGGLMGFSEALEESLNDPQNIEVCVELAKNDGPHPQQGGERDGVERVREALDTTKAVADDLAQFCIDEGDSKTAGVLQFISGFISDRLYELAAPTSPSKSSGEEA